MSNKFLQIVNIYLILLLGFLSSCGKEEFATKARDEQQSGNPVLISKNETCAGKTIVKPPVDFLFLWDNSTSALAVEEEKREGMIKTLSSINDRFSFRALFAPLVGSYNDSNLFLLSNDTTGIDQSLLDKWLIDVNDKNAIINAFNNKFTYKGGSLESGFNRSTEILENNKSNGIFRDGSYVIVVVISSEDEDAIKDVTTDNQDSKATLEHINSTYQKLITFKNDKKLAQLRFLSIVPWTNCQSRSGGRYKQGIRYYEMSSKIYFSNDNMPSVSEGEKADSYDLCVGEIANGSRAGESTGYQEVFAQINNSIQQVTLHHSYDYWPISNNLDFNPEKLIVRKVTAGPNDKELKASDPNGYEYVGYKENQNTRYDPTPGEPYTGYMIRLLGDGKVTHPDCILIERQTPPIYYAYIVLSQKPKIDSINISINGTGFGQWHGSSSRRPRTGKGPRHSGRCDCGEK